MDYALMFDVLEGGVSQPIHWDKNNLTDDRNIIMKSILNPDHRQKMRTDI